MKQNKLRIQQQLDGSQRIMLTERNQFQKSTNLYDSILCNILLNVKTTDMKISDCWDEVWVQMDGK